MKNTFKNLWDISDVLGITLLSFEGSAIYHEYRQTAGIDPQLEFFASMVSAVGDAAEIDLVYENLRLYVRRAAIGHLIIAIQSEAAIAMVRLNCDVILPELKTKKAATGLKNLKSIFVWDDGQS